MKRYLPTLAGFFLALLLLSPLYLHQLTAAPENTAIWQVYFSPQGGCTKAVVDTLAGAKKTVLVQAYSFTSAPIARALVDAKKRGVDVRAVLDKSQWTEKYSGATFLAHAGIPTLIDDKHAIAHNKVMVIDGGTVITGSFNFTRAAEDNNAENLLILKSTALAAKYAANWQLHARHSVPYSGYIGNTKSHKFHRPDCSALPSAANRVTFATREDAIKAGYTPCGICKP